MFILSEEFKKLGLPKDVLFELRKEGRKTKATGKGKVKYVPLTIFVPYRLFGVEPGGLITNVDLVVCVVEEPHRSRA